MLSKVTPLSLVLLGLLALPLAAQTTEETPVEPETETEPGADPAAPGTDPAAQPAEAAQEPQVTVEEIGDWQLRCEVESGNCFMYQLATDEQDNPVSEMNIVALPDDSDAAAGVTVVTPLGTLLTEGLVVQIDGNPAKQYAYNWCTRTGCFSRFGLSDDDVAWMKRGANARIRIVSISNSEQPVILSLSLAGFTAAFTKLTEPE